MRFLCVCKNVPQCGPFFWLFKMCIVFCMEPNVCICLVKCWVNFEELQLFLNVRKCLSCLLENFFVVDLCKFYYNLDRLICILQ